MKKIFLFLPLLLLADIDPFSAGLNSSNPYGLTPTEKAILNNKKEINKLKLKINNLSSQIDKINLKLLNYDQTINTLNERLSAFNTVISELDDTKNKIKILKKEINSTKSNYDILALKVNQLENNISLIKTEISSIKDTIKEINKIQNENFNYLKNSLLEIIEKLKKQNQKSLSAKEAFKKGRDYFFSGNFEKAKGLFLYSLSKNYFPATSSYYLGEIEYKNKNYKKALAFYKKSIKLYPKKTSFTDKLLYHSGISFERIGNKKAAILSFKKLINDFPNSKYAKLAKKELEKFQ